MAKDTAEAPAVSTEFDPDSLNLHVYEPTHKPGKYDSHITAMIAADEKLAKEHPEKYAKGARTAVTVTFPGPNRETKKRANGDEYEAIVGEEAKYKRFFQDSAKAHSRTAKVVSTKPQGDGLITYEFVLGDKVSRKRDASPSSAETSEDTPTEEKPAEDTPTEAAA